MEEEEFEERNYYEIQLNNRQLVLVFIGTIIIGLVIFVLGVNVGKNKKEIELTSLGPQLEAVAERPESEPAPGDREESDAAAAADVSTRWDMARQREETASTKEEKPVETRQPDRKRQTSPPTEKTKPAFTPPPAATGDYTVQVASLTTRDAANVLKQRLASRGYDPIYIVTYDKGGQTYYRVRVGRYASRQDAGSAAGRLEAEAKLNLKTWVCKLDQ
jgi:cell division septation protein DedD